VVDITKSHLQSIQLSLSWLNPSAKILAIGADCSIEQQVEDAVTKTVETFGRIDVCFNAAGISGAQGGIVEQTVEDLDTVLGVNLKGLVM
jgi:NAD(P)-dependent dehydrogenase (short-subunit alcohol dehydrogenase family)